MPGSAHCSPGVRMWNGPQFLSCLKWGSGDASTDQTRWRSHLWPGGLSGNDLWISRVSHGHVPDPAAFLNAP